MPLSTTIVLWLLPSRFCSWIVHVLFRSEFFLLILYLEACMLWHEVSTMNPELCWCFSFFAMWIQCTCSAAVAFQPNCLVLGKIPGLLELARVGSDYSSGLGLRFFSLCFSETLTSGPGYTQFL